MAYPQGLFTSTPSNFTAKATTFPTHDSLPMTVCLGKHNRTRISLEGGLTGSDREWHEDDQQRACLVGPFTVTLPPLGTECRLSGAFQTGRDAVT
jgi:hypothetical protein